MRAMDVDGLGSGEVDMEGVKGIGDDLRLDVRAARRGVAPGAKEGEYYGRERG